MQAIAPVTTDANSLQGAAVELRVGQDLSAGPRAPGVPARSGNMSELARRVVSWPDVLG